MSLEDIGSGWSFYHMTLLVRMQLRSYAHVNQIYPAIQCVLCLALQFQQCAKEVVAYIFLYVHDINIVGQQQIFPIWQLPPCRFVVINYSFSFVTSLSHEPCVCYTWLDMADPL